MRGATESEVPLGGASLGGVPLAIVPLGTANLTARALGVPGRVGQALEVAFEGRDRRIDLGCVAGLAGAGAGAGAEKAAGSGGEAGGGGLLFAAMAGIGLDAAVVGAVWPPAKRRVGWVAYALAGLARLGWPASEFTLELDGAAPVRRWGRCVVVANAGLLPGGFTLLPGARLDDGRLDVGILAPAGGWDWVRLGGRVLGEHVLGRRRPGARGLGGGGLAGRLGGIGGSGRLRGAGLREEGQVRGVRIGADRVLPRQADGEVLGAGRVLDVSVRAGSLVLRLPR